ncbi:MAG TPA: hypothetical protein VGC47_11660 [Acidimicrobiia bacterium]|jgi:hypothetical protein
MGQTISLESRRILGDVLMLDTDRSITGQDGVAYASPADADASDIFPARLAARLFAADDAIDHVFVASNQVVVRRPGGWDEASTDTASTVVRDFFRFYNGE